MGLLQNPKNQFFNLKAGHIGQYLPDIVELQPPSICPVLRLMS